MNVILERPVEGFVVRVLLGPDRLRLFLQVLFGQNVSRGRLSRRHLLDVIEPLVAVEPLYLAVLDDVVRTLERGDEVVQARRIAHGEPAQSGVDGTLKLFVRPMEQCIDGESPPPPFDNVRSGQVVAEVTSATPGAPGRDVLGGVLPPTPGRPASVILGGGLRQEPRVDGERNWQELVATVDGALVVNGDRLSVERNCIIQGDLSARIGSITFPGAVRITGDVLAGLSIRAREGIEVHGAVRGGSLMAAEGPIRVRGFVYGGKGSLIVAGREFSAAAVHEVTTEVLGDIRIEREALGSQLRTASALLIHEGMVIGGEVHAVRGVDGRVIGSDVGTPTTIHLVADAEASMSYAKLLVEIELHDEAIRQLELRLGPLAEDEGRLRTLDEGARRKAVPLLDRLAQLRTSRGLLVRKRALLVDEGRRLSAVRVSFLDWLHEGVTVHAGGVTMRIAESKRGPASLVYRVRERRFEFDGYEPIAPTLDERSTIDSSALREALSPLKL